MEPLKIAIADDHQLFREGLRFILESTNNKVVIDVSNGQELLDALARNTPDVVLMDLKMPVLDGIESLKLLKQKYPGMKVIVLTMHHEEQIILHLLDLGANGYMLKNSSSQEIITAIQNVMARDYYFTDYVTSVMLKGIRKEVKPAGFPEHIKLTRREEEILQLICKELTTTEIADKLFISDRTVESHRKSLLEKLESKNTAGLVIKAMKYQLVQI
jgi:DNA-binding NarL/FixJ family response regulator